MNRSRGVFLVPAVFARIALIVSAVFLFQACGGGGGGGNPPSSTAVFPLQVDSGKRYLVDASGKPFLMVGDAAWSLIVQLTDAEVDQYLDDRKAKGFNTILVNLLEHRFTNLAPNTITNIPPFLAVDDFSQPNPTYFEHVDLVIRKAAARGILVMLAPAYLGSLGGNEGWYGVLQTNDTADSTRLRTYGRYLGQRYKDFTNILWVHSGDYSPPNKSFTQKIALGIRDFDTRALSTAHNDRGISALPFWQNDLTLQVNTIYSDSDVVTPAQIARAYTTVTPFLLIEGVYENMSTGTEQSVRVEAYQTLLSGGMGYIFGNSPMWHFSSSVNLGQNAGPAQWPSWLSSPGALSMAIFRRLMEERAWSSLQPVGGAFLTGNVTGSGDPYDLAVAARASNGSFAMVYLPSTRSITVDVSQLAGPKIRVRWFDPAMGSYSTTPVAGSPFLQSAGPQAFTAPGSNASTSGTYSDWVLILDSVS